MGKDSTELEELTRTVTAPKVKTPKLFKVILLNDDFTPMDFVIEILKRFFNKQDAEAIEIMMQVHNKGFGVAGVYQFDIAETKAHQVNMHSRKKEHPLKCTVEAE